MAAEEVLRARLTGSAPLSVLVGAKIFGGRVPENTMAPFVLHRRVSGQDEHTLDGVTDIRNGRFQVDCYGTSYSQSIEIARAVSSAVQAVVDGDLHAEVENVVDIYEDEVTPKMFRRVVDFVTLERNI
jgi:hypothetical protein